MLKCPYPTCNFTAFSFYGLKTHIRKMHPLKDTCPVCDRTYRELTLHLKHASKNCEKHRLMYVLYAKKNTLNKNIVNEWTDFVIEELTVR